MLKSMLICGLLMCSVLPATAQTGNASYYSDKFNGRRTASGQIFSNSKMTAAHRTMKFGTKVRVTNLRNKRSVIVIINDRGPFIKGRIIDLSKTAALQLGLLQSGVGPVKIQKI